MSPLTRATSFVAAMLSALMLGGCARQALMQGDAVGRTAQARQELDDRADLLSAQFAESHRARNCTAEFRANFDECETQTAATKTVLPLGDLSRYRVIVVHGLMGEVGIKFTNFLDNIDSEQRLIDYLKDQKRALQAAGADVELLEHKSDAVERGGAFVAQRVLLSDRPVLLVSHSKGGLDTLEALLILQRSGQLNKVAGWVAIQAPFHGAPEADALALQDNQGHNRARRIASKVALKLLGAKFDAVRDMTTAVRGDYLDARGGEIERLTAQLPVLCYASWIDDPKESKDSDTDGAVPMESAILPGSDFVVAGGVSHSITVIGSHKEFDRRVFTRTLTKMLLERVSAKAN